MAEELSVILRTLRRQGKLNEASLLVQQAFATRPDEWLQQLAWQHEPFWWQPLHAPRCRLVRRNGTHAALLRRLWGDQSFMERFHRLAASLPNDDAALQALLEREHWALPEETRAMHWVIEVRGVPTGLVSVVDWSLIHRRAEFLIGVLPETGSGVAADATHAVIAFLAGKARLEKLTASFYADNPLALRLAEKLGFKREGVLREHIRALDGTRSDLVLTGLLLKPEFLVQHARSQRRLSQATTSSTPVIAMKAP
jgi:RimJ/RimL family protein N-acetyltransferase